MDKIENKSCSMGDVLNDYAQGKVGKDINCIFLFHKEEKPIYKKLEVKDGRVEFRGMCWFVPEKMEPPYIYKIESVFPINFNKKI